jgi:cell shape-determining protein MreC
MTQIRRSDVKKDDLVVTSGAGGSIIRFLIGKIDESRK